MIPISNFNSVIEVSIAINALFVFFDLLPKMDKHFQYLMQIPPDLWEPGMSKEEERYITTYGWKTYGFSYARARNKIKTISLINSVFSLLLLVFSGFVPDYQVSKSLVCIVLSLLLAPVLIWSLYFYIVYPKFRRSLAEKAKVEFKNLANN